MVRHHENDLFVSRRFWEIGAQASQHGDDKTESGWERRLRCRDDLMECAAGKPAVRQVAIKCDKTKRKLGIQGLEPSWMARQQKAQFGQSGGSAFARRCRRKSWQNKHLRLLLIELCGSIFRIFLNLILEQKENKARGKKFETPHAKIFRSPGPTSISRYSAGFAFRTVAAVDCRA
jgi:hypothetical protein